MLNYSTLNITGSCWKFLSWQIDSWQKLYFSVVDLVAVWRESGRQKQEEASVPVKYWTRKWNKRGGNYLGRPLILYWTSVLFVNLWRRLLCCFSNTSIWFKSNMTLLDILFAILSPSLKKERWLWNPSPRY